MWSGFSPLLRDRELFEDTAGKGQPLGALIDLENTY